MDSLVGERATTNLVAALRETLSNAYRHAHASRIDIPVDATVTLPDGTDGVRLTVTDDGIGIPAAALRSGLRNLARRAQSLGGSSTYGPGPDGTGTTVGWEAPLGLSARMAGRGGWRCPAADRGQCCGPPGSAR